jgi:hypothetical protein
MAPKPNFFASVRRLQKERSQPRKSVLGSSPGEDVFYSSETKHDKKERQHLSFLLQRNYRDKGHNHEYLLCENDLCSSETKDDKRKGPRLKFVSAERLQEQMSRPRRTVLGSSPGEDAFCKLEKKYGRAA